MRAMFQLGVADSKVFEFERSLARRLPTPSSVLQALGSQQYLLNAHIAKTLFPGAGAAEIRAALLDLGATQVKVIKGALGVDRLATRAEPAFVPRYMAPSPIPAPGDYDWHLKEVRLPETWDAVGGLGAARWLSVRVGHIDTGYTEQPALGPWQGGSSRVLRTDLDANFFNSPNEDPLSALEPDHADGFPFHGTRTLCTLAGNAPDAPVRPFYGAAPGVEVVPIRDTNSILVDDQQPAVCAGIRHAVTAGCRVITISQGITLLPMPCVQQALDEAYENGVIVVAAAGQYYLFGVVAPARLKHSIAVGGTVPGFRPWLASCSGPEVDISAPAEPIRVASTVYKAGYQFVFGESNGTSYATPLVAGTAALWLARWGDALDAQYPEKWQRVEAFRLVLRSAAHVPPGWDTQRHGAGVLDALATVSMNLPAAADLRRE